MTWTPNPSPVAAVPRLGWSPSGPAAAVSEPRRGWWSVPQLLAADRGVGQDLAAALARAIAADQGAGQDAVLARLASALLVADHGVGQDLAGLGFTVLDIGVGQDLAQLGLTVADHGIALDGALFGRAGLGDALDHGIGQDLATVLARLTATDTGAALDEGSGGYTPQAAIIIPITATSTIAIPPWPRYVDRITLGAGGGGAGGNQTGGDGRGGQAGTWVVDTLDRGPSRNTWLTIAAVIGDGGGGGARNSNGTGTAGGATTLTVAGNTLTAAGGAGGSGINPVLGSDRPGRPAGNTVHQGQTYTGGTGSGNEPGSGGDGGGGAFWPLNSGSGSTGAKGRAWIRFWM